MNVLTWYFGFHAPIMPWAKGGSPYTAFGHVEAFGYTKDDTWLFFDPQGRSSILAITHLHDEVEDLMADRYARCREIIRIPNSEHRLVIPYRGPLTCVSQCAALLGWRAYTLSGFRRKLLTNGAEVIYARRPEREQRGQEGETARAETQPDGTRQGDPGNLF